MWGGGGRGYNPGPHLEAPHAALDELRRARLVPPRVEKQLPHLVVPETLLDAQGGAPHRRKRAARALEPGREPARSQTNPPQPQTLGLAENC